MKLLLHSLVFGISFSFSAYAQYTIDECWKKAEENYPMIERYGLIEQSENYTLSNASKGWLPQFSLSAKATYQSDVTKLPMNISNMNIKTPDKDQYQVAAEVSQAIWDGGNIRSQRKIAQASSVVEKKQQDVNMYALRERINNLFFGILLLDEQLKQNAILQQDLERQFNTISSYIESGIANQADLDAVKVIQLNTKQQKAELTSSRNAYLQMLSSMTDTDMSAGLVRPDELPVSTEINRPELFLFNAQQSLYEQKKNAISARNMTKFSAFFQGLYGNPGLNMLKNDFAFNYVAGIRMSWNFGSFYTKKNDIRLIETDKQNISIQKETFLYNTKLQILQETNEIKKLRILMTDDSEIILLRKNIVKASEAKVENGTLSVSELLRDINSESQAVQNKILHEIQLLKAIYQLKNTTNN